MKLQYYKRLSFATLLVILVQTVNALPIDKSLIAYTSAEGQHLLQSSQYKQDFYPLSQYFETQQTQTYCGIASAVIVLNALQVPQPIDPIYAPNPFFTQNNIFTPSVLKITQPVIINKRGIHISELTAILNSFSGVKATAYQAKNMTMEQFRNMAMQALQSGNSYIIASLYRPGLLEPGEAHFSPLAAYDKNSDRFLLLDVARYKYPPVWVTTKNLWTAISSPQSDPQPGFIWVTSVIKSR